MCKSNVGALTFVLFLYVAPISAGSSPFTFTVDGNFYVFHPDFVTWSQAIDNCSAHGGRLWTPEDMAEQVAVQKKVNLHYNYWWMWTGINDLNITGTFHSLDGKTVNTDLYKWHHNHPFPAYDIWRCVGMYSNAEMGMSSCDVTLYYTCKFSKNCR